VLRFCLKVRDDKQSEVWHRVFQADARSPSVLRRVIPRLHDEAGSTSWLYELVLRALVVRSCARRAHNERSSSQLVEPASSCKRGITGTSSSLAGEDDDRI